MPPPRSTFRAWRPVSGMAWRLRAMRSQAGRRAPSSSSSSPSGAGSRRMAEMSDILGRILGTKRREVEEARAAVTRSEIERRAREAPPPRGFERALREKIAGNRPAVIAEIKRASPSKGVMRADLDPAGIAASYEAHGAACLSVLTDREFFGGSPEDLKAARAACRLPVLRKDFIIDAYQVHESRSWGADCILLIMDAIPDSDLAALESEARGIGLGGLVECHDSHPLEPPLPFKTPLIGGNTPDLPAFETRP